MKWLYTALCLSLAFGVYAQNGYTLTLCSKLDKNGNCIDSSDTFKWNGDKQKLTLRVTNPKQLQANKLIYTIYSMKNQNDGDVYARLILYVKPEWAPATKDIYFITPGYYKIEVTNEGSRLLGVTYMTLLDR